jgi:hypothetical protein
MTSDLDPGQYAVEIIRRVGGRTPARASTTEQPELPPKWYRQRSATTPRLQRRAGTSLGVERMKAPLRLGPFSAERNESHDCDT